MSSTMSDELRDVVHVELSSVRPPLWSTAPRDTRESEVTRRMEAQGRQPCHLPLYAEPVARHGMTPQDAEEKAVAHLRCAEIMLRQVTERGAPDHVLERFLSHVRLMKLQTEECAFRKDKPLPQWILVDGTHRWYVAQARNDPKIYLSVPRSAMQVPAVIYRPVDAAGFVEPLAPVGPSAPAQHHAKPASSRNAVSKSTELGAFMNHISHVNTPMNNADRVFLLQSWYVAALNACGSTSSRSLLRDFLKTGRTVLKLLAVAVRRYKKSGGAGSSVSLDKRMNTWADDGEALLNTLNDKVFFQEKEYIAGIRDEVYLELPPAMVLVIVSTTGAPTQSMVRAPCDLVRCALQSVDTSMSRILMGLAVCETSQCTPEQSVYPVVLDADAPSGTACRRLFQLKLNTFEGLWRGITVRDDMNDLAAKRLGPGVPDQALTEVALIIASAVGSVDVVDHRFDDDFPKPLGEKYAPLHRHHLPENALLMRAIVKVSMRAWLGGVSLEDVCTRLASVHVAVGKADLGLGRTIGDELNTQDLSFLVRAEMKGIFVRVRDEDGKEKTVPGHSTKCFLSNEPAVRVTTGARADSETAAALSTEHICDCDFFTETACSSGVALKEAFFLSRAPLTDMYRKKKVAVASVQAACSQVAPASKMSLEDLSAQMLLLKNDTQSACVKSLANKVEIALGRLEACGTAAERLSHTEEGEVQDAGQNFMRRGKLLDVVQDLLQSLRDVAIEVGLAHYKELEGLFDRTASMLEAIETIWDGSGGIPALEKALDAYEPSDAGEKQYKTTVTAAQAAMARYVEASAASTVGALTQQQKVVGKWRTRVRVHEKGCNARSAMEAKQKEADRLSCRYAAARNGQESGKEEMGVSHGVTRGSAGKKRIRGKRRRNETATRGSTSAGKSLSVVPKKRKTGTSDDPSPRMSHACAAFAADTRASAVTDPAPDCDACRGGKSRASGSSESEAAAPCGGASPRAAAAARKLSFDKQSVAGDDAPRKSGVLIKYTNALKECRPRKFTLEMGLLTHVAGIADDGEEDELGRHGSVSKKLLKIDTGGSDLLPGAEKHSVRRVASGEKERDVKVVIDVQYAVVTPDESDSRRFAIDTGHEVFHVCAANREERDSWVAALAASRQYFSGLVERAASRTTHGLAETSQAFDDPARKAQAERASQMGVCADDAGGIEGGCDAATAVAGAAPGVGSSGGSEGNGGGGGDGGSGGGGDGGGSDVFVEVPERAIGEGAAADGGRGDFGEAGTGRARRGARVGLAEGGIQPRAVARYAGSAASTEDSVLGDDGRAEAAASRRALEVELRRVITTLVSGEPESLGLLFDNVDAPGGIRDLCTWTLHVLQTDTALVERRVEAGVRRYLGQRDDAAWTVNGGNDGDIDEGEFYDTVGRDSSASVSREASEGGRLQSTGSGIRGLGVEASVHARSPVVAHRGTEESDDIHEVGEAEEDDTKTLARVDARRIAAASSLAPRTSLPPIKSPPPKLNIWQLLKDAIGKDLSKISLPVGLNEPLGFLQRLAEDIEYSELLDEAAAEPDQHRRLLLVAAMVISHYSSTQARIGKPFNPLQGETYSLVMPNKGKGVRFLAEQVSNDPPRSVCYAEGSDASWKYYNSIEVKNKFWGKSLEIFPTGWNYVEIPGFGDVYEFEQVTTSVHNIFLGASKMWLDNYGDMVIVNRTTGDRCEIKFQKSGMFSDQSSLGAVSGVVYDCNGKSKLKLSGRWADAVYEDLPRRQRKLLWKVRERPPLAASNNYNMTQWAIELNQPVCEEDLPATLCTDSRVRPDLRAFENGDFETAGHMISALENGQRARRAAREARGDVYTPRWFYLVEDPTTGREEYKFNGQFFRAKAGKKWKGVEDIFGCARDIATSSSL